jgi:uncharacterized membrane protein YfcA
VNLLDWTGLAATTFAAALLQAAGGFGFAVLATPLFLLFVEPARAIQLVIIVTAALSIVVLPGLHRAVAPRLLLRLTLGSLAGLPLGLIAFRYADPRLVRAVVGAVIVAFAALLALSRHRLRRQPPFGARPVLDLAAGAVSGAATALIGMSGPPVLMYLLLVGTPPRTARATLLSFFALAYGATLVSHAATIGIPAATWLGAGVLIPFALLGGFAGRSLGDRLGAEAFTALAIGLLGAAGLYTLAAAAGLAGGRQ